MLKLLGRLDGAAGLPLAQPDISVQADAASNDVDVILVRVPVAHGHPRLALVKAHAPHEVGRHGFPFLGGQALARRQRKRAMPDGLADVRAQPAHG